MVWLARRRITRSLEKIPDIVAKKILNAVKLAKDDAAEQEAKNGS
jgi:hypothetical protein